MNKIFKILEGTAQGIMINGGFYLVMEEINYKAITITIASFYIMVVSIIFQED